MAEVLWGYIIIKYAPYGAQEGYNLEPTCNAEMWCDTSTVRSFSPLVNFPREFNWIVHKMVIYCNVALHL